MANENISTTGIVIQRHGGDAYRIKLENGLELVCHITNRFRVPAPHGRGKRRPKIVVGDKVKVELHPQGANYGMLVGFVN